MSTLRKALRRGWTAMPNSTLRDPALSFRAAGVLAVLLTHAEGYNVSSQSLSEGRKEGRDAVRAAFKELREAGYMKLTKYRLQNGQVKSTIDVSDHPIPAWITHDPETITVLATNDLPVLDEHEQPESDSQASADQRPVDQSSADRASARQAPSSRNKRKPPTPPPGGTGQLLDLGTVPETPGRDVQTVFDAWVASTGRNRTVLDSKRKRLIEKRLKDFPVADLVAAVEGWEYSQYHAGDNTESRVWNEIERCLRDAANVEMFRDARLAGKKYKPRPKDGPAVEYR